MGNYVNGILTNGENVLFETKKHWGVLVGPAAASLLVVGIPFLIKAILDRNTSEYVVTSRRVVVKTGIFSRNTFEMNIAKIEGATVNQSVWGRLLDYGTVIITGTGGSSPAYRNISRPMEFKRMIDEMTSQRQ